MISRVAFLLGSLLLLLGTSTLSQAGYVVDTDWMSSSQYADIDLVDVNSTGQLGLLDPSANWTNYSSMTLGRTGHIVEANGSYIYSWGGTDSQTNRPRNHYRYNVTGDTWDTMTAAGTAQTYHAGARVGDDVYSFGDWDLSNAGSTLSITASNIMQVYNISGNSWSTGQSLPAPRGYLGGTSIGEDIYAIGGSPTQGFLDGDTSSNSAYRYNTSTGGSWVTLNSMSSSRWGVTAAAHQGFVYAIGGATGNVIVDTTTSVSTVERFNPSTGQWSTMTSLTQARYGAASVSLGNYLYVMGGFVCSGGCSSATVLSSVERYDASQNTWTTLTASMPTARSDMNAAVVGGAAYVIGGDISGNFQAVTYNQAFGIPQHVEGHLDSREIDLTAGHIAVGTTFRDFNYTGSVPTNTSMRMQVRSAGTQPFLPVAQWLGPDGSSNTVYSSNQTLGDYHDGNPWLQYRVVLNTTQTSPIVKPVLDELNISYALNAIDAVPSTMIPTGVVYTVETVFEEPDGLGAVDEVHLQAITTTGNLEFAYNHSNGTFWVEQNIGDYAVLEPSFAVAEDGETLRVWWNFSANYNWTSMAVDWVTWSVVGGVATSAAATNSGISQMINQVSISSFSVDDATSPYDGAQGVAEGDVIRGNDVIWVNGTVSLNGGVPPDDMYDVKLVGGGLGDLDWDEALGGSFSMTATVPVQNANWSVSVEIINTTGQTAAGVPSVRNMVVDSLSPLMFPNVPQNGSYLPVSSSQNVTIEVQDLNLGSNYTVHYWLEGSDSDGVADAGEYLSEAMFPNGQNKFTAFVNDLTNGNDDAVLVWVDGTDLAGNYVSMGGPGDGNEFLRYTNRAEVGNTFGGCSVENLEGGTHMVPRGLYVVRCDFSDDNGYDDIVQVDMFLDGGLSTNYMLSYNDSAGFTSSHTDLIVNQLNSSAFQNQSDGLRMTFEFQAGWDLPSLEGSPNTIQVDAVDTSGRRSYFVPNAFEYTNDMVLTLDSLRDVTTPMQDLAFSGGLVRGNDVLQVTGQVEFDGLGIAPPDGDYRVEVQVNSAVQGTNTPMNTGGFYNLSFNAFDTDTTNPIVYEMHILPVQFSGEDVTSPRPSFSIEIDGTPPTFPAVDPFLTSEVRLLDLPTFDVQFTLIEDRNMTEDPTLRWRWVRNTNELGTGMVEASRNRDRGSITFTAPVNLTDDMESIQDLDTLELWVVGHDDAGNDVPILENSGDFPAHILTFVDKGPDLAFFGDPVSSSNPKVDDVVKFDVTIQNLGDATEFSFNTGLWVVPAGTNMTEFNASEAAATQTTPVLTENQQIQFDMPWKAEAEGDWDVYIWIDYTDANEEKNETENLWTTTITVTTPALINLGGGLSQDLILIIVISLLLAVMIVAILYLKKKMGGDKDDDGVGLTEFYGGSTGYTELENFDADYEQSGDYYEGYGEGQWEEGTWQEDYSEYQGYQNTWEQDGGWGAPDDGISPKDKAASLFGKLDSPVTKPEDQTDITPGQLKTKSPLPIDAPTTTPSTLMRLGETPLNGRATLENFVQDSGTQLAYNAVMETLVSPGTYNPLFVHGPGRMHLLNGLGLAWQEKQGSEVKFVNARNFIAAMMRSLETGQQEEFIGGFKDAKLIMVDDIDHVAGKKRAQTNVMRLLTQADSSTQFVFGSTKPMKKIKPMEEGLRNRLSGGLVVKLKPPTEETRMVRIASFNSEHTMNMSDEAVNWLASQFENTSELNGALNRLKLMAKGEDGSELDLDFVKEAVDDLI